MNCRKQKIKHIVEQTLIYESKLLNKNLFENPQIPNRPPQTSSQTNNQAQGAQNTAAQRNNQNQTSQNRTSQTKYGGSLSAPRKMNRPGIDVPHRYKSDDSLKSPSAEKVGFVVGLPAFYGGMAGGGFFGPVGAAIGALAGAAVGAVGLGGQAAGNWWDRKQQEHNEKRFEDEQTRNFQARRQGGKLMADTQARIQDQQKAQKSGEKERAERLGLPWTDEFGIVHNA